MGTYKAKWVMVLFLGFSGVVCAADIVMKPSEEKKIRQLLIIDTDGKNAYSYRNLQLLATSVGFQPEYKNFYTFLEDPSLAAYDAVFFMIGAEFLKNRENPLARIFLDNLALFTQQPHKLLGILLPDAGGYQPAEAAALTTMLEKLGVFAFDGAEPLRPILASFLKHILPDGLVGRLFGTTLLNRRPGVMLPPVTDEKGTAWHALRSNGELVAQLLPEKIDDLVSEVNAVLPFGLYVHNPTVDSAFFISKGSIFNAADLGENFFRNPQSLTTRNSLLAAAQQALFELHQLVYKDTGTVRPALPEALTLAFMSAEKQRVKATHERMLGKNPAYAWMLNPGIRAGWYDLGDFWLENAKSVFDGKSEDEKKQMLASVGQNIIDFSYDAGLNLWWFEFNPERYLSHRAVWPERREAFIKKVTDVAQMIKAKYEGSDQPMPKIFVGTDITLNFWEKPVACSVKDVFGNDYSKVPCPLDSEQLWKTEVLDVFDAFVAALHEVLPIDGIFFDFEMYHAQEQAGGYSDLMDFSDNAWQVFLASNGEAPELKTVEERVEYLRKAKQFAAYFTALEQKAKEIGQLIKEHVRSQIPAILLGAYVPNLPDSWFYRGMLAGLSAPDEPLILATFNTDFYSHYAWLAAQNIYLLHGAVMLLSKFQSADDFGLIDYFLKYHDFIWYNRPTRIVYPTSPKEWVDKQWWASEATPMPAAEVARAIREHSEKAEGIIAPNASGSKRD